MSREKQIEEIKALNLLLEDARVDKVLFNSDGEALDVITVPAVDGRVTNQLANILYNAGYRKQSEGEWEKRTFILFDSEKVCFRCLKCNTTWDADTNFCPKCGAKMKGGAE